MLAGAENPDGARAVLEWLLSPEVQAALPESMYVFPVVDGVELPDGLGAVRRAARRPPTPSTPRRSPRYREEWLTTWTDVTVSLRRLLTLAGLAAGPLAVLAVFFVLPVAAMVSRGFFVDGTFDPGGVLDVLARPRVHRVLWFTIWSAAAGTLASLALGLPAAYALYRLDLPLRRPLRALLLVPFALPTVVVGVAFRRLLGEAGPLGFLGLDGTPVAIVAGLTFFNTAVVIRAVGTAWEGLDPRPAEAAAALGATPAQVLRTVTLPALRPALVAATSVVFLFCATSFGVVLTLGGVRYSSVETEIYLLTTNLLDLRAAAALSVLQIVVVVVLLVIAQRLRSTPDPTQQRTSPRPAVPAGATSARSSPPACCSSSCSRRSPRWCSARCARTTDGAWTPIGRWRRRAARGRRRGARGAGDAGARHLAADRLRRDLDVGRRRAPRRRGRDAPVALTPRAAGAVGPRRGVHAAAGVSAVTVGFGFLIALDEPPLDLRDSPLLVPIAQALVALPLVVRTLAPVLGGVDDRQRQAAASLGASPLRAVITVDLPVVWKPLLAAAGFAFAVSLGEFGATAFLARDESPTLPVVIYRLLGHPGRAQLRHGPGRLGGARHHDGPGRPRGRAAARPSVGAF